MFIQHKKSRPRFKLPHSPQLRFEELEDRRVLATFSEFVDPNPNPGNQFGLSVVPLETGNVVITSPFDDAGGTDAGAVYLFDGSTGTLISTLVGSTAADNVGNDGVVTLPGGNYLIPSADWDNGTASDAGAVTFGDGTAGVSGVVDSTNSLIGTSTNDRVGDGGIVVLENGNYIVRSSDWDNGAAEDAGAVTFGDRTVGVTGDITSANSLIGSNTNDQVGSHGVVPLTNGNYVAVSPRWDQDSIGFFARGAVTFGNGTTGISGEVSSTNSLVGTDDADAVGSYGVVALGNGNYVVSSPGWKNGTVYNAGAVTFANGTTGISGEISPSNSLVGSSQGDFVGSRAIVPLANGNYVVVSDSWHNGTASTAGAVTFGDGTVGVSGVVSSANSLVGSNLSDQVGFDGVVPLENGNYIVRSSRWDDYVGAVTFGDGITGVSGVVSSANSLVGSKTLDLVGQADVVLLKNGNYVVATREWDNGTDENVGAVTFGDGTTGVSGVISGANSLIGSSEFDNVGGNDDVVALENGNYVVISTSWDNGTVENVGAVTFGDGTTGISGVISIANSLIGSRELDFSGASVVAIKNGNYVVISPRWNNGASWHAGAATFGNGSTGISGVINSTNSLVGTNSEEGLNLRVVALENGNYIVARPEWTNSSGRHAGAVTFGNGITGVSGVASSANSLVGGNNGLFGHARIGSGGIIPLEGGNYLVRSPSWSEGFFGGGANPFVGGAVTFVDGSTAISGTVNSTNSLIGSSGGGGNSSSDQIVQLNGGNYVIRNSVWGNQTTSNAGAVTFANASSVGQVNLLNSVFGSTHSTDLQDIVVDDVNGNFYAGFLAEEGGRVRVGSQATGFPVVSASVGDFNSDGTIDAADFTVWRDNLGESGVTPLSGADGDGDGTITQADYEIWKDYYGSSYTLPTAATASQARTPRAAPRPPAAVVAAVDTPPTPRAALAAAAYFVADPTAVTVQPEAERVLDDLFVADDVTDLSIGGCCDFKPRQAASWVTDQGRSHRDSSIQKEPSDSVPLEWSDDAMEKDRIFAKHWQWAGPN